MSFGAIMGSAMASIFGMTGEPATFQRASGGDPISISATLDEPARDLAPGFPNYAAREQRLQMEFPRAGIDSVVKGDLVTYGSDAATQYAGRSFRIDSLVNLDALVITVYVDEVTP
ncbi:MAG TPA: hypothetical protein VFS13_00585 [Steroidobacteraceae bacterium]|nr:hypothetical protein [Steroidobacteraceae bacterium]